MNETNTNRFTQILETVNRAGTPDQAKSLSAWKTRAMNTRRALMVIKKEHDQQIHEASERYSQKVALEKIDEIRKDYEVFRKLAVDRVREGLEETISQKRATFERNSGAPSEESLRLLQVLKMRKTLTLEDISSAAQHLHGNVQSLEVLRDLARDNGYSFPSFISAAEFEGAIEKAEAFAKDKLKTIDKEDGEMDYKTRMFWLYSDDEISNSEAQHFFSALDNNEISAAQITKDSKTSQTGEDADGAAVDRSVFAGGAWCKVKLHGGESLMGLAYQFHTTEAEIRKANGGRADIIPDTSILIPSTKFRVIYDETGHHTREEDITLVPIPAAAVTSPDLPGPNPAMVREFMRRGTAADALDAED